MRGTRFVDQRRWVSFIAIGTGAIAASLAGSPLAAQAAAGPAHNHSAHASPVNATDTYLAAARRATATVQTPDAARAAGFVPVFGNAPLQGEHFARPDLVMRDSFDMNQPSVLMFAPVGGRATLVGVAYTFYLPADRDFPRGWDGTADVWHTHDDIARVPGKHIVMMHTWLVDAPDGPLAHVNPWLPYYAAGLTPPLVNSLSDSAGANLARRVGLALGLVTQPPALVDIIQREAGPVLAERMAATKDRILALVPRMRALQQAGDTSTFDSLRRETAAAGDALVSLYREGAKGSPRLIGGIDTVLEMYLGRPTAHRGR